MLAFAIDNFLPEKVFSSISTRVTKQPQYKTNQQTHDKDKSKWVDDFTTSILDQMKENFINRNIWLKDWNQKFYKNCYQVARAYTPDMPFPSPHLDLGGFVYYIHPAWEAEWGGRFYIEEIEQFIDPLPNRLIWVNPPTPHCVEPLTYKAPNNRMCIVGQPTGTMLPSHIQNQKQLQVY